MFCIYASTYVTNLYADYLHFAGKAVSGYVVRNGQWINIGKHDPLQPQMFYPANKGIKVTKGDILVSLISSVLLVMWDLTLLIRVVSHSKINHCPICQHA